MDNIDASNKNIYSFTDFPKIIDCQYVDVSNNFLSDLRGLPNFESVEAAKKCSLSLRKNPIISLDGAPDYLYYFNLTDCSKLKSLQHCPEISGCINVEGCKSLKDMVGLRYPLSKDTDGREIASPTISIIANRSGLTSFKGCPKQVKNLIVAHCDNLRDFYHFPDKVARLNITIFHGCLLILHDLFHEKNAINFINLFSAEHSYAKMAWLSSYLTDTKNPFEFQEFCIDEGFEDYL